MPRFEDYFKSQQTGVHPFDSITDRINEELKGSFDFTEEEKEQEKELHKRELLGRLMGERLTPRQFEILTGQYRSSEANTMHVKDTENRVFMENRDIVRLH